MLVHIEGKGDIEIEATAWTLVIYEHEFKRDLIADFYGKHDLSELGDNSLDFTSENWNADLRVLWAMAKTAYELADMRGEARPIDKVPSYVEWVKGVGKVNMHLISKTISEVAQDGFFHTGAAASE